MTRQAERPRPSLTYVAEEMRREAIGAARMVGCCLLALAFTIGFAVGAVIL